MRRRRHCEEADCKIDKAGRGDEDEKACNTQECPGKFLSSDITCPFDVTTFSCLFLE